MAALDAATGNELWWTGYPAPYEPARPTAAHGSGPKATPVYADGRLFTLGITGILSAFDASSGNILWRTDPPEEPPFFSAASSPLVERGLVIAHPGNYGPLTAFDAATGEVRWTAGAGGFFASPITTTIGDTRQVVTMTSDSVIGVLPEDGAVIWRFPWAGANGGPTPVIHDETVIVSAHNQGVAAFRVTRSTEGWRTEPVWTTTEVSMYLSSPVVVNDILFGLSHKARGQYFALEAETGKTLWLGEPRQAQNTVVSKAGTTLLLLNDDGEFIVAKAGRDGPEPVRRYVVDDGPTWAQPAISGNRIFVRGSSTLTLWTLD